MQLPFLSNIPSGWSRSLLSSHGSPRSYKQSRYREQRQSELLVRMFLEHTIHKKTSLRGCQDWVHGPATSWVRVVQSCHDRNVVNSRMRRIF
jgi:hypothetical protein